MSGSKIDTRAIGLDTALALAKWLTGKEHLHYGLWTGIAVCAANVGAAQDAYSDKLFGYLPQGNALRILDIGGGAGETAAKLIALGHKVEIVVPSDFLAERCRANAPAAVVHHCTFQEAQPEGSFDLCLFSESFQYIPLAASLPKAKRLLNHGGTVLIGDCFRADSFVNSKEFYTSGGGHKLGAFRGAVKKHGFKISAEEDITTAVAPSIDVEQALFNVLGRGILASQAELARKAPLRLRLLGALLSVVLSSRKRSRLARRLFEQERNSATFIANNRYMIFRLLPL